MNREKIIVSIYTNASGFLYSISMINGTNLGWSDGTGDCEHNGAFTSYEKALETAMTLIENCNLEKLRKESDPSKFHWSNYANFIQNYGNL